MALNCGKLNPFAALIAGICIVTAPARAQVTLEGNAGVGYSSVGDLDAWLGLSPHYFIHGGKGVNEPALMSWLAYLQVYFGKVGPMAIGAEVGAQHFFSYNWVDVPGPAVNVGAARVMGVARFQATGPMFFEVGAGGHMDLGLGASAAVGYKVPLGPKMFMPLKLRADLVNNTTTISVSGGLSVGF